MSDASYYIIIARKNQVLLSFFNIRVIVNDKEIYPLLTTKPVLIPVKEDHLNIVVTDGFHFTRPLKLAYDQPGYFSLEVVCIVDDLQLLGGSLLLAICYLLALFTGFLVLKVLSFLPIVCFLVFYYVNRKNFLQIKKASKRIIKK